MSIAGPAVAEPRLDSWRAWTAAAGATLAATVVYGIAYGYGQFFGPMSATFGTGMGAGSVVFSITMLFGFGMSALTGPLADRIGPQVLLVAGASCIGIGLYLTSIAQDLWQAYVTYGLGVGLGLAFVYVPVVTAIGRWFDRYRAIATGVVVAGVGIGTVVTAPLSEAMVAGFGWRQAYETYAIGGAALLLLAAWAIGRPPCSADRTGPVSRVDTRGFGTIYLSTLLLSTVMYVPFAHLAAAAEWLGSTPGTAATLISVIGISSIVGRLAITAAAGRLGALVMYQGCHVAVGLSCLVWMAASGFAGMLVFAVVIGLAYGGYSALIPVVLAERFGIERLGTMLGLLFTAIGAGAAIGPVLVGYAVEQSGSYTPALTMLSVFGMLGAGIILTLRPRPAVRRWDG
ncbi:MULTISPECIES: MFS transporter [Pseudonocardia]|uniref:MFS transporter n=2 Tax=Pseudonocardia TaxID=1847 RepID=A0ABQ0RU65_9PSEU|nr:MULTISPECIES: MFS transporter [Pseudonocardia]OSY41569.1 putative MFS-type transporter YhjX [Pseudonocardia autotrophica]TDN71524.1 cyanate permease [Pseudonocardia autotrophica]BBG02203.1 MFS transporter [Pseudonocardia autotrophica]GEC24217.1 MFS transporter [Pseudonocardia saturnea]